MIEALQKVPDEGGNKVKKKQFVEDTERVISQYSDMVYRLAYTAWRSGITLQKSDPPTQNARPSLDH